MQRKALIVGIDNYTNNKLTGCVNDAQAIKAVLSKNEDGSPNFDVQFRRDLETRAALFELVKKCFSGDSDVALFYFSGHGFRDNETNQGYLVTPDSCEGNYGLALDELVTIANNSQCRNKVIILDCCYAGSAGESMLLGGNSVINEGVTILCASRSTEEAIEVNGHGVFTSLLEEALKGGAADITGHITPGGIYAFVDKALGPWDQRPIFKTNVTSFVSLRKVKPQVDEATLRKISNFFEKPDNEYPLDPSYEFTNTEEATHEIKEPYSDEENVKTFKALQALESVGLVRPVEAEHMYFAAMNSKSCELTALGKHYWRLAKEGKI